MPDRDNPQDVIAQLIEEARLGWVCRVEMRQHRKAKFIPFHPPMPGMDELPMFFMGELPAFITNVQQKAFGDALEAGEFALPYWSFGILYRLSNDNPALLHNPDKFGDGSRWYLNIVKAGIDDRHFAMMPFMLLDGDEHWVFQSWSAIIMQGERSMRLVWDDNAIGDMGKSEFLALLEMSAQSRVELAMADIHKIMAKNATGRRVIPAVGTALSERIAIRRERLQLPPVPPVRIIDFNAPPILASDPDRVPTRRLGEQPPHWRRGTTRTYHADRYVNMKGKTQVIAPYAVHGGAMEPPPWYEVRG